MFKFVPSLTVPPTLAESSSPSTVRIRVVLPTPLLPMIPTLSPRMSRVEKFFTSVLPSYCRLKSLTSQTIFPDFSDTFWVSETLPATSRRCFRSSRSAFNARTRPSLRVRLALMPWRIHTSSWASFLSNSSKDLASLASSNSFNSW